MVFLKLLQSIFNTLHSEGTPGQVAAGFALGSFLALTPLSNLHNLVVFALILMLNVSFGGAMLGWAVLTPLGFLLDPVFHRIGRALLVETPALTPLWTSLYNAPVVPLSNFNNTVVLGSFVFTCAAFVPIYFLARVGVDRYRVHVAPKVINSGFYRALSASKLYNVYRLFKPQ